MTIWLFILPEHFDDTCYHYFVYLPKYGREYFNYYSLPEQPFFPSRGARDICSMEVTGSSRLIESTPSGLKYIKSYSPLTGGYQSDLKYIRTAVPNLDKLWPCVFQFCLS